MSHITEKLNENAIRKCHIITSSTTPLEHVERWDLKSLI